MKMKEVTNLTSLLPVLKLSTLFASMSLHFKTVRIFFVNVTIIPVHICFFFIFLLYIL